MGVVGAHRSHGEPKHIPGDNWRQCTATCVGDWLGRVGVQKPYIDTCGAVVGAGHTVRTGADVVD